MSLREEEIRAAAAILEQARREQEDALKIQRARIEKARADREAMEAARIEAARLDNQRKQEEWIAKKRIDEANAAQQRRDAQQIEERLAAELAETERAEAAERAHKAEVKRLLDEAMHFQDIAAQLRREEITPAITEQDAPQILGNIPVLGALRFPHKVENEDRSDEVRSQKAAIVEADRREAERKEKLALRQEEQAILQNYAEANPVQVIND